MSNKLQIKRTTVSGRTPNTTSSSNTSFIDIGELAINLADGKLFSSNGTVSFEIGANLSSLSVTGSGSVNVNLDVGANLTIDGTLQVNNVFTVNSSVVSITQNDILTFNDSTTQNTAFRVYDATGTRIA